MAFDRTTAIVSDLAGRVLASSLGSIASCAGGTVALLAWSRRPTIPMAATRAAIGPGRETCMGHLMSSGFGRDGFRPDHGHCFGPGRTSFSVQPWEHRQLRWRHSRPVGLVAPTNHPYGRYTRRHRTRSGDLYGASDVKRVRPRWLSTGPRPLFRTWPDEF